MQVYLGYHWSWGLLLPLSLLGNMRSLIGWWSGSWMNMPWWSHSLFLTSRSRAVLTTFWRMGLKALLPSTSFGTRTLFLPLGYLFVFLLSHTFLPLLTVRRFTEVWNTFWCTRHKCLKLQRKVNLHENLRWRKCNNTPLNICYSWSWIQNTSARSQTCTCKIYLTEDVRGYFHIIFV